MTVVPEVVIRERSSLDETDVFFSRYEVQLIFGPVLS